MKTAAKFGLIVMTGIIASLIAIAVLLAIGGNIRWVIVPTCGIAVIAFVAAGVGLWDVMGHYIDGSAKPLLEADGSV